MTGEMYWIQFDDGCTDSLDECYCWQCTFDSLQANQEAATSSAASDCGSSEFDDDDAEEEGATSDAPSICEDSDASSDGEETETGADTGEDNAATDDCEYDQSEEPLDYWRASTEVTKGCGINVRREPCMSSLILGTVEPGDKIQATRERFGSWMKVVPWEGQGAGWIRRFPPDLLEFEAVYDASSVYEDSDASSDDEETGTGDDTGEHSAASGDDPGDDKCGHNDEGDSDESDAADSSDAFLGASGECEAGGRWKSHDCSMDYSQ